MLHINGWLQYEKNTWKLGLLGIKPHSLFQFYIFFQRLLPLNLNSPLSYPSIMYGRTSLEANPRPFPFCLQFFWWLQAVFWLLLKYKFWSNRTDNFGKRLAEVHMYACKGTEQISPVQKYCQHPLECCLGSRLLLYSLGSCEAGAGGALLQCCALL